MTETTEKSDDDSPFFLKAQWVRKSIGVNGSQARAIHDAFVTKGQLIEACESGEDLTTYDGIGEKTASAIWDWFRSRGGTVDPDGELVLDDEGLHLPEWLVGYVGTFNVETPTITMRPTTTDEGLGEVSDVLGVYPNAGEWNERLEEGMIALSKPGHDEVVYEIDDQRTEDGGENA